MCKPYIIRNITFVCLFACFESPDCSMKAKLRMIK